MDLLTLMPSIQHLPVQQYFNSEMVGPGDGKVCGTFDGSRFSELTKVYWEPSRPYSISYLIPDLPSPPSQDAPTSRTILPMTVAWIPRETAYPYVRACMAVPLYCGQDYAVAHSIPMRSGQAYSYQSPCILALDWPCF